MTKERALELYNLAKGELDKWDSAPDDFKKRAAEQNMNLGDFYSTLIKQMEEDYPEYIVSGEAADEAKNIADGYTDDVILDKDENGNTIAPDIKFEDAQKAIENGQVVQWQDRNGDWNDVDPKTSELVMARDIGSKLRIKPNSLKEPEAASFNKEEFAKNFYDSLVNSDDGTYRGLAKLFTPEYITKLVADAPDDFYNEHNHDEILKDMLIDKARGRWHEIDIPAYTGDDNFDDYSDYVLSNYAGPLPSGDAPEAEWTEFYIGKDSPFKQYSDAMWAKAPEKAKAEWNNLDDEEEVVEDVNGDGDPDVMTEDTDGDGEADTATVTADDEAEASEAVDSAKKSLNDDKKVEQDSTGSLNDKPSEDVSDEKLKNKKSSGCVSDEKVKDKKHPEDCSCAECTKKKEQELSDSRFKNIVNTLVDKLW